MTPEDEAYFLEAQSGDFWENYDMDEETKAPACKQCGEREVEASRAHWATPACSACLPLHPPIKHTCVDGQITMEPCPQCTAFLDAYLARTVKQ